MAKNKKAGNASRESQQDIFAERPRRLRAHARSVTFDVIDRQIRGLIGRTTRYQENQDRKGSGCEDDPSGERWASCHLKWLYPANPGRLAESLGPYSRWLIAVHLLLERGGAGALEAMRIAGADFDRVFHSGGTTDLILTPNRYIVPLPRDGIDIVFDTLIKLLDDTFKATRLNRITRESFMAAAAPLRDGQDAVGEEPIVWFKQWIEWGVTCPSTATINALLDPKNASALSGPGLPGDRLDKVVCAVARGTGRSAHQRIVNVSGVRSGNGPSTVAADLARTLREVDPTRSVVYLRLDSEASRQSIVKSLYEQLRLDTAPIADLQDRRLDLATDLAPLRWALTVNRTALIIDRWDNAGGPFSTLYEYLCHTQWGEALRVLAQPHLPLWKAGNARAPADYVLVVFSARDATELKPWCRMLDNLGEHADDTDKILQATRTTPQELRELERGVRGSKLPHQSVEWQQLVRYVGFRMIAASVNGLRRTTLERCLSEWIQLYWAGRVNVKFAIDPKVMRAHVEQLLKTYGLALAEFTDEEVERLSTVQRDLELNREPQSRDPGEAGFRKVIAFRSLAARAEFVREWIEREREAQRVWKKAAEDDSETDVQKRALKHWQFTCSWAHTNLVLAEESLRQATSQLRHLPAEAFDSPYSVRRVVQTIYHGLMSLDGVVGPPVAQDSISNANGPQASLLPADELKRYRYLVTYLFKQVVEAGEWRLNRAFGRSDIKAELLKIVVEPWCGPQMLAGLNGITRADAIAVLGDPPIAPLLKQDAALWSHVIIALGRSSADLGSAGDDDVRRALALLPDRQNSPHANALLPIRGAAYYQVATEATMLCIDWRQARNELPDAAELCWEELARYGIASQRFSALRDKVLSIVRDSAGAVADDIRPQLEALLATELQELMRLRTVARVSEHVAAVLFRLGEIVATEADNRPATPSRPGGGIGAFAYAFAVYWIADRMRSASAMLETTDLRWPLSGARTMRYYVRVCLELAFLLTRSDGGGERLRAPVNWFLDLAQSRIGAFSRHHYRFRRAQVSALSMECARIRAWIRVNLERQTPEFESRCLGCAPKSEGDLVAAREGLYIVCSDHFDFLNRQARILEGSWLLLQEAEDHLFALGYQAGQVRRLLLERIKNLNAFRELSSQYDEMVRNSRLFGAVGASHLVNPLAGEVDAHEALKDSLLDVLDEASEGSAFWKSIAKRLRVRDDEALWEDELLPAS